MYCTESKESKRNMPDDRLNRQLELGLGASSVTGIVFSLIAARSGYEILNVSVSPSIRSKLILVVTVWGALASFSTAFILVLARCRAALKRWCVAGVAFMLEDDATGEIILDAAKAGTRSIVRKFEQDDVRELNLCKNYPMMTPSSSPLPLGPFSADEQRCQHHA